MQAFTGLPVAINVYGREANGHVYADHFFMGAGQGGSRHGDGKSALLYPTSAANTSVELMEARAPVLVLEKSFVTDCGGAGAASRRLRRAHATAQAARRWPADAGIGVSGRRRRHRPRACTAASPGGGVRGVVLDPNGNVVQDCGTGELVTLTRTDRIVEVRLAGGAGFGDPRSRPTALVEQDVAEGIVSVAAASVTTDFHWLRGRRRSEGSVRHRCHCERSEAISM